MASNYFDILTKPEPKASERADLLRMAMMILSMMQDPEEDVAEPLDGSQPEIYVAPRYSPSP